MKKSINEVEVKGIKYDIESEGATLSHNELENLDYEDAGHTGFTPSRLSLLQPVDSSINNHRLTLIANVGDVPSKLTLRQLQDRMIRTSNTIPDDLQIGQYLFLEKEGGENNGN